MDQFKKTLANSTPEDDYEFFMNALSQPLSNDDIANLPEQPSVNLKASEELLQQLKSPSNEQRLPPLSNADIANLSKQSTVDQKLSENLLQQVKSSQSSKSPSQAEIDLIKRTRSPASTTQTASTATETTPIETTQVSLEKPKDSYESRLAAAQDERKNKEFLQSLVRGVGQIGAGAIGSGAKIDIQPTDLSFITKDVEEREKAKIIDQERALTKDLSDPNSPISIAARERLVKTMPELAKKEGFANISAAQLQKMGFTLKDLFQKDDDNFYKMMALKREERQEKEAARREEREDFQQRTARLNAARALLKDDARFAPTLLQVKEFDSVADLMQEVEEGNELALSGLGTVLAKAMGEKGVLTDTDVVRYVGAQSWGRKLKDWYSKGAKGELPKESIIEIKRNIASIRTALDKSYQKIYKNAGNRLKAAYPELSNDEVKALLGATSIIDESEKNINKEQSLTKEQKTSKFPMNVYKDGKMATVSNQQEYDEAISENWSPKK